MLCIDAQGRPTIAVASFFRMQGRLTAARAGACSSGAWSKRLSSTCLDIFFTPRPPVFPAGLRPDISRGLGGALGATGFTPAAASSVSASWMCKYVIHFRDGVLKCLKQTDDDTYLWCQVCLCVHCLCLWHLILYRCKGGTLCAHAI